MAVIRYLGEQDAAHTGSVPQHHCPRRPEAKAPGPKAPAAPQAAVPTSTPPPKAKADVRDRVQELDAPAAPRVKAKPRSDEAESYNPFMSR
jgi:hypothetical protein